MEFGERMRKKRKALGLTLEELGEKVGLSHGALSRIENGAGTRPASLAKIKSLLGLRGGAVVGKPKRPARKSKAATEKEDAALALSVLVGSLEALRASVDGMRKAWDGYLSAATAYPEHVAPASDCRPSPDLPFVPSVEEQRKQTAAMTEGIAKNGLRRPLVLSNSLDRPAGAPVA